MDVLVAAAKPPPPIQKKVLPALADLSDVPVSSGGFIDLTKTLLPPTFFLYPLHVSPALPLPPGGVRTQEPGNTPPPMRLLLK